MTAYLLDENVLKELSSLSGNENVRAWYAAVSAADIYISVMTMFEKRRGWERLKKSKPAEAASMLARLDALEAAYGANLVSIDAAIAPEWARLLGAKEKNQRDRASAANGAYEGPHPRHPQHCRFLRMRCPGAQSVRKGPCCRNGLIGRLSPHI